MSALGDLAILLAAFVAGTLLALAVGATNLGTALGVGQIGFILAVVFVLLRRGRRRASLGRGRGEGSIPKRRRN